MKVTCPGCSAQYTLADERLDGRRVKVRCKRCGDSFPVDASQQSAEVYARRGESRRARDADLFAGAATAGAEGAEGAEGPSAARAATPLTGERNESSVLFSLAALSKQAPASQPPKVSESSALIDIRALVPRADDTDDIMHLGGGGAFAPLFAPPVTFVPAENEEAARVGQRPIVIGAMALGVVALVGIAALVGVRSRSSAPRTTVTAPAEFPSVAGAAPGVPSAVAAREAPPASSAPLAAVVTPVRTSATSNVAPPARSAAHANDARSDAARVPASTASTASTQKAATKCCPGESELACQVRVSTGAACSAEPAAPPFDRLAAARALGLSVGSCKRGDGPTGAGRVKVTFQPSGSVSAVDVAAPYAGTAAGACIAQRYRGVSVPAFAGGPLSVGKSFAIE